jgi:hypothetical protein
VWLLRGETEEAFTTKDTKSTKVEKKGKKRNKSRAD